MNDNIKLEEKALEVLASHFYNNGYRKGVAHGIVGCCAGMIVGLATGIFVYLKEEGCFKKTEDEE